jgi:plastocyanin
MRRTLSLAALAIVAAVSLAACAGSTPGWTYAPPTEAPPSQPPASGAPSAGPSAAPSQGASEAPTGDVVNISAFNIQYEQTEVRAPAGTTFTIRFENKDAGTPHNVEIKDSMGTTVFKGDIFPGVETRDYRVDPLPAGTYQFVCTVHPNMVGTLIVGG